MRAPGTYGVHVTLHGPENAPKDEWSGDKLSGKGKQGAQHKRCARCRRPCTAKGRSKDRHVPTLSLVLQTIGRDISGIARAVAVVASMTV
eukprot:SAG11_NODE_138_length_15111_cov_11.388289_5_plen_90_part_00